MVDIARLTEIIEPEVTAMGFELVRVRLFGKTEVGDEEHTLQIMAERPETGQLVLNDCAGLSHRISDAIDAREADGEILIADAYRLEVSSPGIDRPLTRPKDYAQWAGHEAKLLLNEPVEGNRMSLHGTLVGIDSETVRFDDKKSGSLALPLTQIKSAKLVLTDRLIAASKPLDVSDADDLEEIPDEIEAQED